MTPTILIRQGNLRFHWDRKHHIHVEKPDGESVGFLFAGNPCTERATLDEVHDVIDEYVEERKGQ